MTDSRRRVLELYHQALGRDADDRDAFLRDACAGDSELQRQVEALLLDEPPPEFLGPFAEPAPVMIGRQIGPYRVESQLGAGGMGEVFRAHDTKLGRDVAIKILPRVFSSDPDRRSRFEREARVLATLNHSHIGAIYGLEDADGVPVLILELVDGETLAEHLKSSAQGPGRGLPVAQALTVAKQIAEALDAAHDRGIVHRDLKPANVVFTGEGSVKVLDFGLAKAVSDGEAATGPGATRTGMVMGTPAYMSPEQAKGAKVDKRADIWAFGCVLFEMLTGRPPFAGETAAETLAAVLHHEPPWKALPADTPAGVRMVLTRCLEKDPRQRVRDIGDVRLALAGAFTSDAMAQPAVPVRRPLWRRVSPVLAALLVGGLITAVAMRERAPNAPPQVTQLSLGVTGPAALNVSGNERDLAITPDGSRVVYVGVGARQLFVRSLDALEPLSIRSGAVVLRNPFISADGRWVGFAEDPLVLKKMPIAGGPAITIARTDSALRGAAWLADNTIVFATSTPLTGLQRVSADGGMPTPLTTPDTARGEFDHLWPAPLPGGRALLYTVIARSGGLAAAHVGIYDLEAKTSTPLLSGASNAMYVPSGHLVYIAGGALWAVSFDPDRRTTSGTPAPMVKDLVMTGNGAGVFDVSPNGTLVYGHGAGFDPLLRTLSWIDRQGKIEPTGAPPHPYVQPKISHDGTRVVTTTVRDPEDNIWVWDFLRRALTRVTTGAALDIQPAWSPDDRWIVFSSNREEGFQNIWRQASNGAGAPQRLTNATTAQNAPQFTPDGTRIVFGQASLQGDDVPMMELRLDTKEVRPLQSLFNGGGTLSPDGRWLAGVSNRSGRTEVYVDSYPNAGAGRWQVSFAGGRLPLWARDGREIFFLAPDGSLMGSKVRTAGAAWSSEPPVKLLEPDFGLLTPLRNFDVSPDGKKFLVVTPFADRGKQPELIVVQHWDQELRSRVPAK